jgi:hypothetical protein
LITTRVSELSPPPPCQPEISDFGVIRCRSLAWYMYTVPRGILCDTTARQATTPLRLYASIQSLSATPMAAASCGDIQMTGPPRNSRSMCRLSWYSEWIDHFECGVRYRIVTSGLPSSARPCSSGTATMSVRLPRCVSASREKSRAMAWNASKSVLVSQGGAIAGLNECTNGCMSVEDRSCFSYSPRRPPRRRGHPGRAAGMTIQGRGGTPIPVMSASP